MINDLIQDVELIDFAVIPILVNTGAAILPAIIAGLANFFSILLNPRKLFGFIKTNPVTFLIIILLGISFYFLATGKIQFGAKHSPRVRNTRLVHEGPKTDWAKVSIEIIKEKELQKNLQPQNTEQSEVQTVEPVKVVVTEKMTSVIVEEQLEEDAVAGQMSDVLFRGNIARSGYLGGKSPVNLTEQWRYEEEYALSLIHI